MSVSRKTQEAVNEHGYQSVINLLSLLGRLSIISYPMSVRCWDMWWDKT